MTLPQFAEDTTEQEIPAGLDDAMSTTSIKAAIKWEERDGEYVLLWYQSPFYVVTDNGGYSMTYDFFDTLPDHLEKFWIVDKKEDKLRRIDREQYENEGVMVEPSFQKFRNHNPPKQIAVDKGSVKEEYDLPKEFY